MKKCIKCDVEKELTEFHKRGNGHRNTCKSCVSVQGKAILKKKKKLGVADLRAYNTEKVKNRTEIKCTTCGIVKPVDDFSPKRCTCKKCSSKQAKSWKKAHPEQAKEQWKSWKSKNLEHVQQYKRAQWDALSDEEKVKQLSRLRKRYKRPAHTYINKLIKAGTLQSPSSFECVDKSKNPRTCLGTAQQYDHYLGYDRKHWDDIEPVCYSCHGKRGWERRNSQSNLN